MGRDLPKSKPSSIGVKSNLKAGRHPEIPKFGGMKFASYCLAAVNVILSIHSVLGFHSVSPIVRNGPVIRSGRNAGLIVTDAVTIRSQGSSKFTNLLSKVDNKEEEVVAEKEPSAFDQVASKGLAGVLAIAAAEA